MCCIFTCCGWLIDLFQRAWVFAMTFCMSGAVCCVLLLGSMSGVALGYNYSLAEYMDLKETNVSVYLKRGVFDDEGLSDDMNFRRSGEEGPEQMPNQARRFGGGEEGSSTLSSGRRLDDSLLESNQNHGYEGGLAKLTMQPPFAITTTTPTPLRDKSIEEIFMKHAPDSLDQLKEIQSLISHRKALAARDGSKPEELLLAGYPSHLISEQNYVPSHILKAQPSPGRRMWQAPSTNPYDDNMPQDYLPGKMHPAVMAVPPPAIRERLYWEAFKTSTPLLFGENTLPATSPQAIRMNTLGHDMFPTEPPTYAVFTEETEPRSTEQAPTQFMNLNVDSRDGQLEQKLILNKYGPSRTNPYVGLRGRDDTSPKPDNEYYDDDIKGLPVRRKRYIHGIKRKSKDQNTPRPEQEKPDVENPDKVYKVNHNNNIATDPSILVSKLASEYKVNAKASDLIRNLENTPLHKRFMNNNNNKVNHNNNIATDPSILVSKLASEYKVNAKASDLIRNLEKTPLHKRFMNNNNNKVNHTNNIPTDPSILVSTLASEYKVNAKANDLISNLEKTPLHKRFMDNNNNKVNHTNNIPTDPSTLVSTLASEYKVNVKASDLISNLEKTPLHDRLINNKVYETESRIWMRGLLGRTSRDLNKMNHKLNDASSAVPDFINNRRFVFSFV